MRKKQKKPCNKTRSRMKFKIDKGHVLHPVISELRSCVKDEVDVLGSPSLIVRTVSVDVKQH